MKILITTDLFEPQINGVVTSVINLKRGLEELGHEVRILTLSQNAHSSFQNGVYRIGSISTELVYPGTRICLRMPKRFFKDIISWEPDIVHSHSEIVTYVFAKRIAQLCKTPLIHTYHTNYEEYTHYFCPFKTIGCRIISIKAKRMFKSADQIIAPSFKIKKILTNYNVSPEIEVVPSGIVYEDFSRLPAKRWQNQKKQDLSINSNSLTLVYVGRLAREKNVLELIDLLSEIKDDSINLLIVGDGPFRETLEKKCREFDISNKVTFAGMINPNEVWKYYHLGDIFVNASTSEAQGMSYIEAMASGLPLLCKKDECLKDLIIDGENGWQYTEKKAFFEFINTLATNSELRCKMSVNSKTIAQNYSIKELAKRIESIYEDNCNSYKDC